MPRRGVAPVKIIFQQQYKINGDSMMYLNFINNILETRGRFQCGDQYHERHHITPKCMGGTDDDWNLIDLFAKEHYEAHKLLALENPECEKLVFAWWIMSTKSSNTDGRYELTAEEYEEAKITLSITQSKIKKAMFENPENHPMYGKRHSAEAKEKMRNAKQGKVSPKKGIPVSNEEKERLRQMKLGSVWSQEQHDKMDGRYANGNSSCCVPVYCPELNESFWGLQEVCDKYGFSKPNISKCLSGERKHCGKHPITGEKLSWIKLKNN